MLCAKWIAMTVVTGDLVALCFTGKLDRQNAALLQSLRAHLIDPLLSEHEIHVFVYNSGEDYSSFFAALGIPVYSVFTETRTLDEIWKEHGLACGSDESVVEHKESITKREACGVYRRLTLRDRAFCGTGLWHFYMDNQCYDMVRNSEVAHGQAYDWVIRTRSRRALALAVGAITFSVAVCFSSWLGCDCS